MYRFRLSHILLCGLISLLFPTWPTAAQTGDAATTQVLPATYQKWLDEDVRYLITEEERAEFATLTTNRQRDKFIEDFWERRNPDPGLAENAFKKEHYRRLAHVNQHFAAGAPGYKTDRGLIYIVYGQPDEWEQHPGRDISIPPSDPMSERFPSDSWRYHFIQGVGRDVVFEFVDTCRCGEYQLRKDPTKKRPRREKMVPVKQTLIP